MRLNIDRWWAYTKQVEHRNGWHSLKTPAQHYSDWCTMTNRQLKRVKKKALARDDWSIGVFLDLRYAGRPYEELPKALRKGVK